MNTLHKIKSILIIFLGLVLINCKERDNGQSKDDNLYAKNAEEELYRPNFHFSPKIGWTNDPNGMFYYNGYYHLFFQHYPDGSKWGPMHWGHAISTDLINWKEMPIALYPDENGYIFSGSAIIDFENKSGLGKNGEHPIIAFFTYHNPKLENTKDLNLQSQAIAYSLDEGLTWTKYNKNPVIKSPGIRDFRDPKVIWNENSSQFILTLAAGQKVMFYGSQNLIDWELLSEFGEGIGNHNGVWECPDLFPLNVDKTEEQKWVLLVSINPGGPNGGSATQYFIGDFKGGKFIVDEIFKSNMESHHTYWIDYGKDNYAGVTWSNAITNDGHKLFLGWMSNWQYANDVPTEKWRNAMTLPRELFLTKQESSYRLNSIPYRGIKDTRSIKFKKDSITVKNEELLLIDTKKIDLSKTEIKFNIKQLHENSFRFKLTNNKGNEVVFGYDHIENNYFIDRRKSGITDFSQEFANKISLAPRNTKAPNFSGTILLDKSSIELFFDNGCSVMTEIFFSEEPFEKLFVRSESQEFILSNFEIHQLNFN